MHKYEIIVSWSNEDQVFVADVPELPGCMAHGPTEEAALSNIKEAVQLWTDTAKEFGDPALYIDDLWQRVGSKLKAQGVDANDIDQAIKNCRKD